MRLQIAVCFCLLSTGLLAQTYDSTLIRLSTLRHFDSLEGKFFLYTSERNQITAGQIPGLPFDRQPSGRTVLSDSLIERDCFIKFSVVNDGDTAKQVYFLPGNYLRSFRMYTASHEGTGATFREVKEDPTIKKAFPDCRLLTIAAHDTAVYFARFNFIRANTNRFAPTLIEKDFLVPWLGMMRDQDTYLNIVTYIATGILLLMIFYSLAVYLQNRNKELIWYSAYGFCTMVLLFLKSYLNFRPSLFNALYEEYLDFMILGAGVYFYLVFVREFLNTREQDPFLETTLRRAEKILLGLLLAFSMIYFFSDSYIILNILENYVIKLFLFGIGIVFIVYAIKKKDPLLNYLAAGNIALVFFSMVSFGMMIFRWKLITQDPLSIFNRSMLYYEAGLVFELMFFLSGLAYKTKRNLIETVLESERFKMENERQEFEKQMAIMSVRQEERDRISADMHDDLGSGVTAIRLMSEIVKSKLNQASFPEIDKISNSANELLGKMNTIIWTMKSSNDTLESLVAYLRSYAIEYFDSTPVQCSVEVKNISDMEMTGEKRRNIFLSFKETLTNILKHSQATQVKIEINGSNEKLCIRVIDNGIGIDLTNLRRFGNGLNNIKKRMHALEGEITIENDHGTLICFEMPLKRS